MFNDASDSNKFKLFKGTTVEPTTTVNIGGAGYVAADLVVAGLEASLVTSSGDVIADTHFNSSDNYSVLSTTGAGTVFLRPNGKTDSANQLTLESSGNVSIAGNVTATSFITSAATGWLVKESGGNNGVFYDGTETIIQNSGTYTIRAQGSTVYLRNTYVSGLLDVTSGATFGGDIIFTDGAAYSSAASIRQQSNNLIFSGGSDGYYFNKSDNSVTHLRIDSSGNVGIGTTNPGMPLQVHKAGASGQMIGISHNYGLNAIGAIDWTVDGTPSRIMSRINSVVHSSNNIGLAFQTSDDDGTSVSERMRILGGGNVGIGTTTPSSKLQVSGSVQLDVMPQNETEGSIKIGRYDVNISKKIKLYLIY